MQTCICNMVVAGRIWRKRLLTPDNRLKMVDLPSDNRFQGVRDSLRLEHWYETDIMGGLIVSCDDEAAWALVIQCPGTGQLLPASTGRRAVYGMLFPTYSQCAQCSGETVTLKMSWYDRQIQPLGRHAGKIYICKSHGGGLPTWGLQGKRSVGVNGEKTGGADGQAVRHFKAGLDRGKQVLVILGSQNVFVRG